MFEHSPLYVSKTGKEDWIVCAPDRLVEEWRERVASKTSAKDNYYKWSSLRFYKVIRMWSSSILAKSVTHGPEAFDLYKLLEMCCDND